MLTSVAQEEIRVDASKLRGAEKGWLPATARETVDAYTHWRVVENDVGLFWIGMVEMERWQLSFWDSLILAAARGAHAKTILSEDLNHGQNYNGIILQNPFME